MNLEFAAMLIACGVPPQRFEDLRLGLRADDDAAMTAFISRATWFHGTDVLG
jgi:hypothetical protein